MSDKDLLKILACPETHQPLAEADEAFLADLNAKIADGNCEKVDGGLVDQAVEGALIREDGKVAYPIRHSIPVLLVDEGISLG